MSFQDDIRDQTNGKWRGILKSLGVDENFLRDRHGACPFCGGSDRFRFDNKGGRGTWYCNQCGAGDGISFAERVLGLDFSGVCFEIRRILGQASLPNDPKGRAEMSPEEVSARKRSVASGAKEIEAGDLVDKYLTSRGLGDTTYPTALRFVPALRDGEGGVRPCMVASVRDGDGRPVTLHQTFLRPDGLAKAEMERPRKMLPGPMPEVVAVHLSEFSGGVLGVAEGIETAMSASILYEIPVWAVLNANFMQKWVAPANCDEVMIFGDNDASYTGHAAAYHLARRLVLSTKVRPEPPSVRVLIPPEVGSDWNDVLMRRSATGGRR